MFASTVFFKPYFSISPWFWDGRLGFLANKRPPIAEKNGRWVLIDYPVVHSWIPFFTATKTLGGPISTGGFPHVRPPSFTASFHKKTRRQRCVFPASANVMNFKVLACVFFQWILAVKNVVWLKPYNLIFFKRIDTISALLPRSSGIRNLNWPFCHPDVQRLTPCNSAFAQTVGWKGVATYPTPENLSESFWEDDWWNLKRGKRLPPPIEGIQLRHCAKLSWLERNDRNNIITLMPA